MASPENGGPVIDLATALEVEDYALAESLLSKDCVYEFRDQVFQGPAAIIETYRDNGEQAKMGFDAIEYECHVTLIEPGLARIDYTDIITPPGEQAGADSKDR